MASVDRRKFLKMMSAPVAAAALPVDFSKALAIPANNRRAIQNPGAAVLKISRAVTVRNTSGKSVMIRW
ncbi:hypothetical protein [Micromonospora fulviviridis]|uniref:Twin-arginine translocation signal domain-containing protein n=1 Tax=Micromonospora fulviviridis TaxID=47860 RepID=A0ABV2VK54_9ACTN